MARRVLTFGGLALLLTALVGGASGQLREEVKFEEGFTSLFNGRDLTGWTYKGSAEKLDGQTATKDQRIVVEDGIIVMNEKDSKGKGGIKELATAKQFGKNFHLKVDFKAGLKADSGVYVRGPQLQVRDYIRRKERPKLKKFVTDGWNTLDIIVKNDVTRTMVNDQPLKDSDRFSLSYKGGEATATLNGKPLDPKKVQLRKGSFAECFCNGEPLEILAVPDRGPIGLQAESGRFEFRRIRIKELE